MIFFTMFEIVEFALSWWTVFPPFIPSPCSCIRDFYGFLMDIAPSSQDLFIKRDNTACPSRQCQEIFAACKLQDTAVAKDRKRATIYQF